MSDLFQCLDAIPEYRRAALQDAPIAEWTCASAGLEGNTFSLGDTDFFLREGLTVAGKTFQEHCEIKGHADALKWMEHLAITNTPLIYTTAYPLCPHPSVCGWQRTARGRIPQLSAGI